jgi:CheY-like chemotaxis protein
VSAAGAGVILLVEDDADDVALMRRAVRKAKIANDLVTVENGDQAVAYLAGDPPYEDRDRHPVPVLVLLDLKLPRRSGLEVLEWIRSQPAPLNRLRVVILTSSKESRDINRAHELGVNSYLVKPPTFDELLELVRTLDLYWMIFAEAPDVER